MMQFSPEAVRGLWNTLAKDAPDCTVFVSECFFHTVEALVAVEQSEGMDPMALFVLRAFEFAKQADAEHLDEVLHLGRQVTRQLLAGLTVNGLLKETSSTYVITELGRRTLHTGRIVKHVLIRRLFNFLHPSMQYLAVQDPKQSLLFDLRPSQTPTPWEFDPQMLRYAISQPAEWKLRHRFPEDIMDVITGPVSPDSAPGLAPAESGPVLPGDGTAAPQHLIVDKAQVLTSVLVARTEDSREVELTGYPVSIHGSLVKGKGQPYFSLHGPDDIHKAFPELGSFPTAEQVKQSWMAFAEQDMLAESQRADVRFDKGRLVVCISADLLERWGTFVVHALQDHLRWYISVGSLRRLCAIALEGTDEEARAQIQSLRVVIQLEEHPQRANVLLDMESLGGWLDGQSLQIRPSSRDLADLAFRHGCYRLAYEIGELEDMIDAAV